MLGISLGARMSQRKDRLRTYDKKIFRLLYILNAIETHRKVLTKELAEEFNISRRSVQRDIELLATTGFPLASPDRGVYSFAEGFSLRKAMLTNEEASLLAFLCEIAKSLGRKFEDSFSNILKKVIFKGGESAFYAKLPGDTGLTNTTPFIKELESAVDDARSVSLCYCKNKEEKWLRVDPLKIAFYDGFWYLVCRAHDKRKILTLRLENIKKLETLNQFFDFPQNLKTMLNQSVSAWFSEKRDVKVTMKVDAEVASFFKRQSYFPLQKIIKEEKSGELLIEGTVCQGMEAIAVVLRWIPHVRVLKPREIKEEVQRKIGVYSTKIVRK